MQKVPVTALALSSLVLALPTQAGVFADSVVAYTSGTGFTPGYIDPSTALGEPSRVTPGMFGGPVDPLAPPYLSSQLVSLGANGSLTVQFNSPILNFAGHPFGLDFIIFGNSGFDTGPDYNGIANGALFGNNPGATRVSVSEDNVSYYELDPSLAPTVDGFAPTDGSGNFQQPLDPSLNSAEFAGKNLTDIRALYNGSGGGAGFDIGWARDGGGQAVNLSSIRFIRVDVLGGTSEIDGFAAVPEPGTWALFGLGAVLCAAVRRRRS